MLHCVTFALHSLWAMLRYAILHTLQRTRAYVKQQDNRNDSLHPAHLRVHYVALHYACVAFASRFPLRRHYVGIPFRTELMPRVGLRRRCITRWPAVVFTLHWRYVAFLSITNLTWARGCVEYKLLAWTCLCDVVKTITLSLLARGFLYLIFANCCEICLYRVIICTYIYVITYV